MIAQIVSIQPSGSFQGKDGKQMYTFTVQFSDGMVGQATAGSSPPRWQMGQQVAYEVTGNYKGMNKVRINTNTNQPTTQPQQQWGNTTPYNAPTQQPQQWNGQGQPPQVQQPMPQPAQPKPETINGQSVGMSLNNSISIALELGLKPHQPDFWPAVYEYASDILRISYKLEHAQLATKRVERAAAPQQPPPMQSPQNVVPMPAQQQQLPANQPPPNMQAFATQGPDDDVPF